MADKPKQGRISTTLDCESAGERLRAQRKELGLSLGEAAQVLHVDRWMLEALERDDFSALGAPVFAKGHLRKYATLLGLPADDLMIAYYQAKSAPETPPLVADTLTNAENRRSNRLVSIGITIAVMLAGLLIVWWLNSGNVVLRGTSNNESDRLPLSVNGNEAESSTLPQAEAAQPSVDPAERLAGPQTTTDNDVSDSKPARPPAQVAESAEEPPAALDDAATAAQSAPVEPPVRRRPTQNAISSAASDPDVGSQLQLRLNFDGESWVEIYDANEDRLFFGMGQAGVTRTVAGVPPIDVLLGDAAVVDLEVAGQPYRIPPAARRGKTARFSVEN